MFPGSTVKDRFFYLVTAGALAMTLMSIYLKTSVNDDFYCQPPVCIYFMSVQAVHFHFSISHSAPQSLSRFFINGRSMALFEVFLPIR